MDWGYRPVANVTLPRFLVERTIELLQRAYMPPEDCLTLATALTQALGTLEDAPGAPQEASPMPGACRFCRVALEASAGLCEACSLDLLHDAQELEQSKHDCPRCHDA